MPLFRPLYSQLRPQLLNKNSLGGYKFIKKTCHLCPNLLQSLKNENIFQKISLVSRSLKSVICSNLLRCQKVHLICSSVGYASSLHTRVPWFKPGRGIHLFTTHISPLRDVLMYDHDASSSPI